MLLDYSFQQFFQLSPIIPRSIYINQPYLLRTQNKISYLNYLTKGPMMLSWTREIFDRGF